MLIPTEFTLFSVCLYHFRTRIFQINVAYEARKNSSLTWTPNMFYKLALSNIVEILHVIRSKHVKT